MLEETTFICSYLARSKSFILL